LVQVWLFDGVAVEVMMVFLKRRGALISARTSARPAASRLVPRSISGA
jgi:hypothetical protein